jgi:hypothetical protein
MYNKIYDLYCDVSNYLIQRLDADGFNDNELFDQFLKTVEPDIYALYCVLDDYISKKEK